MEDLTKECEINLTSWNFDLVPNRCSEWILRNVGV
jgi:hypothetical protein